MLRTRRSAFGESNFRRIFFFRNRQFEQRPHEEATRQNPHEKAIQQSLFGGTVQQI